MVDNVTEVLEAPKFSTARSFAWRRQERRVNSALREVRQQSFQVNTPSPAELAGDESKEETLSTRRGLIEVADFKTWSLEIPEVPYNLIHCDFPYGVKAGDTIGQSGAKSYGGYEDSKKIYFDLLDTLLTNQDRFIAGSAHLFFWFSMDYYQITKDKLEVGGWTVNLFPLIWFKTDNTGILPDAQRGPRRVYETAFLCTRGDRKIVRAVGNCAAAGVSKRYHMSEKPILVLQHFFRMLVDETTVMLDPTCGSGNAVKVAEELGADWSLGLEINPEYVEAAKQNLEL